jgi:hypothetical protein
MTWCLYPQHKDTLRIVQGVGWIPELVWTWAEDLTRTCIGNLEIKTMLYVRAQSVMLDILFDLRLF